MNTSPSLIESGYATVESVVESCFMGEGGRGGGGYNRVRVKTLFDLVLHEVLCCTKCTTSLVETFGRSFALQKVTIKVIFRSKPKLQCLPKKVISI